MRSPHGDHTGGRGVDDLRWHRPVRPGEELSIRVEIVERSPNEDVHVDVTDLDQDDEPVISWTLFGMSGRRDVE